MEKTPRPEKVAVVDEVRERPDAPEDAHHVADVVLRARRR